MKVVKKLIKEFFGHSLPKPAKALLMECAKDVKEEWDSEYNEGVLIGVICTLETLGYISMDDALDFGAILTTILKEGDC